jgi:hypothetical protein
MAAYSSFLHSVQTGFGAHSTSYKIGTWGSFPGEKAAGAWSSPLIFMHCRGQEWWNYTSTPPYIFMAWCLIHQSQGKLTFYLPSRHNQPAVNPQTPFHKYCQHKNGRWNSVSSSQATLNYHINNVSYICLHVHPNDTTEKERDQWTSLPCLTWN